MEQNLCQRNYLLFTTQEQKLLKKNPYVKTVSAKGITYTDEFKVIAINEYEKEKSPREIFEEAGSDIELVGMGRVKSALKRRRIA